MQVTKALSNEWAAKGICCNSIHPGRFLHREHLLHDTLIGVGYYRTPMNEQYSTDPKYKDFNDYIMSRVPMKRWGMPADLSGAIIFLASSASDYVTGTSIVVDGGFMGM